MDTVNNIGGDESEGRGGTIRRLANRVNEAIARRRTGRIPTASTGQILAESGAGRLLDRALRRVRRRRTPVA